ncbi:hypothetical protein CPB86DRAFT_761997 [Serendipita vermifera]|nr:hypothetical protein CPB86DRAFT_761997 [Serendipita vermifera]
MASLSAHLLGDYENSRVVQQPEENEQIIQSGAMEYNALAHGHGAPQTTGPQTVGFSTFSQASLAHGYPSGASTSALGLADSSLTNMSLPLINGVFRDSAMVRMDAPVQAPGITVQQLYALQQKREEEQALKTANAIATLQAKLNQKLGPEYISQRPGPGGGVKLTYAEGWKIINLANEVFGFNGWSSSVSNLSVDYIDYNRESQRYNVGVTAIVRVTLRDGTSHEDVGYGLLENCKSKGMALDKCKKEAITDALKRTLRSFGNVLGNCLYDKDYIREVMKMKVPPTKFEPADLHRRKEFAGESSNAVPKRPTASTSNPPRTSMPPPPPPTRTPQNNTIRPGPSTSNNTAASTSSTINKPSAPASVAARTPDSMKREGTDESLYVFGSDDDAIFEGFSVGDETGSTILNLDQLSERSIVQEKRSAVPSVTTNTAQTKPSATTSSSVLPPDAKSGPSNETTWPAPGPSKPGTSAPSTRTKSNDMRNSILAGLKDSDLPTPSLPPSVKAEPTAARPSAPVPSATPRTSSGGGFNIPPGTVRPQRGTTDQPAGSSSHSTTRAVDGLGLKRTAASMDPYGSNSGKSERGHNIADGTRAVLRELDVQRDGSVKRPRLS